MDDLLEQARIKSQEFYRKAAYAAIESMRNHSEFALSVAQTIECNLKSLVFCENDEERNNIVGAARQVSKAADAAAQAAREAAEAALLVVSADLKNHSCKASPLRK